MVSANGIYRLSSFPLFRWMSWRHFSSKLFVGGILSLFLYGKICVGTGLSYDTNEPVLKDAFGHHGEIIEVKVICDHKSGKSKGYGFVHFVSEESASKALAEMDDQGIMYEVIVSL
ncbi:hypothetical protein OSB04_001270 [Centaurea solstitialis]|uniref:RRM domain-containing protein n=1 Tax=Centaurea solstitialis TaxID=347529 RepID=A0AA38TQZ9_9ASTR|nr:hypothetical protein OSB04_001270 [Centaurea solstitialis]